MKISRHVLLSAAFSVTLSTGAFSYQREMADNIGSAETKEITTWAGRT